MDLEKQMAAIAGVRLKGIEADLTRWAQKSVNFDFDPSGTDLYSMLELAFSYAKRCAEFGNSIHALLEADRLVSATIIARAMLETVAIGSLYIDDMLRLIDAGDHSKLEIRFKKFYAGQKQAGADVTAVHVLDGLRYLEKIDSAYVTSLHSKYKLMHDAFEQIKRASGDDPTRTIQDAVSVLKNYDFLCEVAHPNGIGTQFLFPDDPLDKESLERLRGRLRTECLVSIWHTHFLIEHLERAEQIPSQYRRVFLQN